MSDPDINDINISYGTCVFKAGWPTENLYLPCGNAAFGQVHCCQAGDMCLENNACYNHEHGTTYLAGCTDYDYKDSSCPDKKSFSDYPWTGLIYCAPNQWVACKEEGKPDTIRVGDRCECPTATESITAAFTAAPVIPNVGKLPMTLGGRIEWENGHFPTSRPAASTTSIEGEFTTSAPTSTSTFSSTTSTTASNTSLPTTTQSPTSSPSDSGRHLSTGAKAGIGIVSVFGAMLLFGALSALWMIWRRRLTKKNVSDQNESCGDAAAGAGTGYDGGGGKNPAPMMALAEMPSPSVPQRPAEMPTPNVPPRPTESGLGMGPWMVVPDGPQGPAYPSGAYGPWPYAAGGEKDWESQGSVQPQPAGYSQGQAESHHSGQWVPREEEKPRHPAIELPG